MKVVALIQARLGSTRLPRKVLRHLAGEPMLAHVMARTQRTAGLDEVVLATTENPRDDELAALCSERGWPCCRGSEDDVLDRYYRAASVHGAETVVRITSDCPLIEPRIIELVLAAFHRGGWDYVSNTVERQSYPRGLDVEVFSFQTLERAFNEDHDPAWREHVTPYIYRNPEQFRIHTVSHTEDHSQQRWTVDTPEDFELVRRIYEHFGHNRFGWQEVLELLARHPHWLELNRQIQQKKLE